MQKALSTLAAATVAGAALTAQITPDPCGPAVWFVDPTTGQKTTTVQQFPELGNLSFNVTEVAQLFVIPNPAGPTPKFLGIATVQKIGASAHDFVSFTWTPGSAPTITTHADPLNGPGGEFQGSLSRDGLHFVGDTGAGHAVGNGTAIVASRTGLNQQFASMAVMGGVPTGYIDPQLGKINGQDVVFYAAPSGGIEVGDIDLNPSSPNYGNVTNVRVAMPAMPALPSFQFLHSPTPVYDRSGETRGLIFSAYTTNSGSDAFYSSAPILGEYPAAIALNGMKPTAFVDDGSHWNANPLNYKGTNIYADAPSTVYGDPLRIESFLCTSDTIPSAGGTVTNVALLPLSVQNDQVVVAFNYGMVRLPQPIDPNTFGIPAYGLLCVAPIVAASAGLATDLEATATFPLNGPLPSSTVLLVQAVSLNVSQNEVYLSNEAYLEVR